MLRNNKMNDYNIDSDYESDCDYESLPQFLSDEERKENYDRHRAYTRAFCNRLKKQKTKFTPFSTPIYLEPITFTRKSTPPQSPLSSISQSPKNKKETTKLEKTQKWSIAKVAEVPSMSVINEEAKTESEWTVVSAKPRKEKSQEYLTTQEIAKLNIRTRMCDSYRTKTECRYGEKCNFAHSVSELRNRICGGCDKVRKTGSDLYVNCHPNGKICGCIHIGESQENFYTRTTGLEKKATEEEMCEAFEEFMNSPPEPTAPVAKKTKEVKNKSWFEWPATFEGFKNLSIEKLSTACRLCNVNSKYFPTKNRPVSKTRNMLLADLAQFAKKRYGISSEEINMFLGSLKQDVQLVKPAVNFKIDIKKLHIQEKNMLTQQIQSLKISIIRKKETVERLTSQKMNSSEIAKVNSAILEFSEKLKNLENSLEEIQDIKKFEEKKKESEEPKKELKVVVSVPLKKIVQKSEPSIISVIVNAVVRAVNDCKEEGWKIVKEPHSRNRVCNSVINNVPCKHGDKCRFSHTPLPVQSLTVKVQATANPKRVCNSIIDNVPCRHGDKCRFSHTPLPVQVPTVQKRVCESVVKNVACGHGDKCRFSHTPIASENLQQSKTVATYSKTKVCESVIRKIPCRHGDKCRYAHVKGELVIKKCDFDNNCNNYNCIYKHSFETVDEFYKKSGF